jgi:parallel beta-helix repeat protein
MGDKLISIGIVSLLVIGGFIGIFSEIPDNVEAPGPTYIGGLISTDTVFTQINSPYIINWNTMVEKGVTLTIEPGVEVRFEDYYYLQIEGKLVAQGTEEDMIIFTSNKTIPAPGDWNAIRFMNNCDNGSSIEYCKIEYSSGSFAWGCAINIEGGIPSITNNYIINNWGGVCLSSVDPYQGIFNMMNNTIIYNPGPGSTGQGIIINEDSSHIDVTLSNNVINNNDGAGIWIRSRDSLGELTLIKDNTIQNNTGGGIWITSSNVNINITNNQVINNTWGGIVFQAGNNEIPGVLERNTIIKNGDGIRIDHAESPADYSWQYNNIYDNPGYNVNNEDVDDWYLPNNWWGTTDTDLINQSIFDYYDDFNYGKVIYMPFLTGPVGEKSIRLKQGCNLISIPLIQPEESIDEVLSSISDEYYAVQRYDSGDVEDPWKHYHTSKPSHLNDLDNIDHTMAFFVYTNSPEDTVFQIKGDQITESQKILLQPGWNLVGYPSLTDYSRTEALNNLTFDAHVDAILTYNAFTQKWEEVGPSDNFEVGKGYFIHAKMKCIWEVPL